MSNPWTEAQLQVINTRDKNILVSAAAGSGKTTVLVERIKRLIIDENVSVDEILVATFTNAAASDMKEKIVKSLKKAITSAQKNKQDTKFLKSQFDKVYKANINTFHAFAISIIRRYFYIINIDPDFKICDDAEKMILQSEAMDELFEEKFELNNPDFIDFLTKYCTVKSEKKAKDMILHMFESIQALPDSFNWLSDKLELANSTDEALHEAFSKFIIDDISENIEYALNVFSRVHNILSINGITSLAKKAETDITALENILSSKDFDQLKTLKFEVFSVHKDEKEDYEEIKEQVSKLRDKGKDYIKDIKSSYFNVPFSEYANQLRDTYGSLKTLHTLICEFNEKYKEKKAEKRLLDFNDVEHYALEILKNEDVANEYKRKFKYIFVDEYQDSNLLQETMVNLIKRENNVFMVGDVKQSIYKFRLAEPEIFIRKYEEYKNADKVKDMKIDLSMNFRCKRHIIDTVNDICEKIMPYDEDSKLRLGITYDGELNYPVELHMIETKDIELDDDENDVDNALSEINELKNVEIEAEIVAKIIKEMISGSDGKKGEIFDGVAPRKIKLSDIAILMRSVKSSAEKYCEILADNDIAAFIDESGGYFDTIEIDVFMNLLKVIDNRRRDIPLISVLHSKIMNFSADELAKIRVAYKDEPYYSAFAKYGGFVGCDDEDFLGSNSDEFKHDAALREKCRVAYSKIEQWRELARIMPLDELIWKLMWETGYYVYIGALPDGVQRQANLRALVDKSLAHIKTRKAGLYGFIQYAEILKEKGVKTGQASIASEGDDVVRIKTIHKSKGLEFPIVIVSGIGKKFMGGREKSEVSMHKDVGFSLPFYDRETRKTQKTLLQNIIKQKNKKESLEEEARILYVALTRAKDRLLLVGSLSDAEEAINHYRMLDVSNKKMTKSFMDMIMPTFLEKGYDYKIHTRSDVQRQLKSNSDFKEELQKRLLVNATFSSDSQSNELYFDSQSEGINSYSQSEGINSDLQADEKMRKEIARRLSYKYPYEEELHAKSKYSVSELAAIGYSASEMRTKSDSSELGLVKDTEQQSPKQLQAIEQQLTEQNQVIRQRLRQEKVAVVPLFLQGKKKLTSAEIGTAMHTVMERLDFKEAFEAFMRSEEAGRSYLENLIKELDEKVILTSDMVQVIDISRIERFLKSDIGKRAALADEIYKESPFNIIKEVNGIETIVQGVIDCWFKEGDEYVLIDYKLGYSFGEDDIEKTKETYRIQVELYSEALEISKNIKVKEKYLYLFGSGLAVEV